MKQLTVRLDDGLVGWLQADAAAHGRTVAQSVRWYLERARSERVSALEAIQVERERGTER